MPTPPHQALARRIALRHLAAAQAGSVLPGAVKQKINSALIRAGMDGNQRFQSPGMALAKINQVLSEFGIEWDEVINSHRVGQPKGRMTIDLATQTEDPFSPVSIKNTALAFHWDTLETGIEVIAYLG